MTLKLTNDQIQTAMRFVARSMIADNVNIDNVGEVVQWMILNPLPKREIYEATVAKQDEVERQVKIAALQDELDRLNGRTE